MAGRLLPPECTWGKKCVDAKNLVIICVAGQGKSEQTPRRHRCSPWVAVQSKNKKFVCCGCARLLLKTVQQTAVIFRVTVVQGVLGGKSSLKELFRRPVFD